MRWHGRHPAQCLVCRLFSTCVFSSPSLPAPHLLCSPARLEQAVRPRVMGALTLPRQESFPRDPSECQQPQRKGHLPREPLAPARHAPPKLSKKLGGLDQERQPSSLATNKHFPVKTKTLHSECPLPPLLSRYLICFQEWGYGLPTTSRRSEGL